MGCGGFNEHDCWSRSLTNGCMVLLFCIIGTSPLYRKTSCVDLNFLALEVSLSSLLWE